jgi:pyrroline-5-carboxylate reductase
MKVGFAGSGNMAAAIARGWASADSGPDSMLFADSGSGRAELLAGEVGGTHAGSLEELADGSDLIVLAVKPAALEDVAGIIDGRSEAVASVLGATTVRQLQEALPATPVLRLMPNIAVEMQRGVICHAPIAPGPGREILHIALGQFGSLGSVVEVEEDLLDAASAVLGCAGAYLARGCEQLIASGVAAGLAPALSERLVREMASGTGDLLTRRSPREIETAIASPGGSTEAGLDAFAAARGPQAFDAAVVASLERMRGTR